MLFSPCPGKYPLFHHEVWLGLLQGPVQSEGDRDREGAPLGGHLRPFTQWNKK